MIKVEADLEENFELMAEHDVISLPTILLKIDDKVWGKSVGVKSEAEYRQWIDTHLTVEDTYSGLSIS